MNLGALYLDQSKWDDAVAVTQKRARQALRRSRRCTPTWPWRCAARGTSKAPRPSTSAP